LKRFHHPAVGDFTLTYEALDLAADEGLRVLCLYRRAWATPSDDALKLLAFLGPPTVDQADHPDRCRLAAARQPHRF